MSGHSKWSTIKRKKGAADAKRGALFSKLARAIIVASRDGGPDPEANLALQNAIEKAREASMPKGNIERAISRGSGADSDEAAYESVTYEGYGPGGVAILVEALTDNRNRSAADIRHIFTKHEGNLGSTGAVAWQFERRGLVLVPEEGVDPDELMLVAADAGADDVDLSGSTYQVIVAPDQIGVLREALSGAELTFDSAEVTMIPNNVVEVHDEGVARRLLNLMDALDENEDVQGAYANFDIPERMLELVAS